MFKKLMNNAVFQPIVKTEHWCNVCDQKKVDSTDKESGTFYVFFGHQFQKETKHYDGDYVGVMLALCPACAVDF